MIHPPLRVRLDAYTRFCLGAIAALLTVLIVGLWAQHAELAADARASDQFGDTGSRIAQQLDAQNRTNAKLDELIRLLTSGQVKVQVVKPDERPGGDAGAKTPQK